MKELSVSESYLLCTLNKNGKLPALSTECPVCLLAGGLADLMLAGSVALDEEKKFCAAGELGPENRHLDPLYAFVREKGPLKLEKLAAEYTFTFSDRRLKQLLGGVGASLAEQGCAKAEKGGLFGGEDCFVPEPGAVDRVIQRIRAELLEEGKVCDETAALASLLDKSGQLKRYFSQYEKTRLKERLKEIRSSPAHAIVKEMVDHVDTLIAVIAVTGAAH